MKTQLTSVTQSKHEDFARYGEKAYNTFKVS